MTKSDMIHRPNHYTWRGGMECVDNATKWKVTMDARDWFRLYREWEAGQSERFNYTE